MNPLKINLTPTAKRTLLAIQDKYPVIVNEGGARCFHAGQLVITEYGPVPISSLSPGQKVLAHDFDTGEDIYATVSGLAELDNIKSCVKIKLKSGKEIICTEDHKIYFSGRWCEAKEILSLFDEANKKL
jgi:hypothetical protein